MAQEALGRVISELRNARDLTQKQLAKMIGTTAPYISQLETGHRQPAPKLLGRLAEALGVSVPMLYVMAMDEQDLPADTPVEKRQAYRQLHPDIKMFFRDLVLEEEPTG